MIDPRDELRTRMEATLDRLLPKLSNRRTKVLLRLDGPALVRRLRSEILRVHLPPGP